MNQIIGKSDVVEALGRGKVPADFSRASQLLYLKRPVVVTRDGRYALYDNGIICDCYLALEWFCAPDDDTSWVEAAEWAKNLTVAGGGWRLPAIHELSGLYKKNKAADRLTPLFKRQPGDFWSNESVNDAEVLGFNFIPGNQFRTYKTVSRRFRAMAVRPRQQYRGGKEVKTLNLQIDAPTSCRLSAPQ